MLELESFEPNMFFQSVFYFNSIQCTLYVLEIPEILNWHNYLLLKEKYILKNATDGTKDLLLIHFYKDSSYSIRLLI